MNNTREIKVCLRPGCTNKYLKGSKCFEDDVCDCAAPLILKKEIIIKEDNVFGSPEINNDRDDETVKSEEKESIFVLDPSGGIHFNLTKEEKLVNEDRVVIYIKDRVYKEIPLEYDETIFGRISSTSEVDIDLTDIDSNRRVSRNHLMIYRQNGEYIARNLTAKNSVHVERTVVREGEDCTLKDGDLIILSRSIVMVFRKGV